MLELSLCKALGKKKENKEEGACLCFSTHIVMTVATFVTDTEQCKRKRKKMPSLSSMVKEQEFCVLCFLWLL